jgi:hypothetical protein
MKKEYWLVIVVLVVALGLWLIVPDDVLLSRGIGATEGWGGGSGQAQYDPTAGSILKKPDVIQDPADRPQRLFCYYENSNVPVIPTDLGDCEKTKWVCNLVGLEGDDVDLMPDGSCPAPGEKICRIVPKCNQWGDDSVPYTGDDQRCCGGTCYEPFDGVTGIDAPQIWDCCGDPDHGGNKYKLSDKTCCGGTLYNKYVCCSFDIDCRCDKRQCLQSGGTAEECKDCKYYGNVEINMKGRGDSSCSIVLTDLMADCIGATDPDDPDPVDFQCGGSITKEDLKELALKPKDDVCDCVLFHEYSHVEQVLRGYALNRHCKNEGSAFDKQIMCLDSLRSQYCSDPNSESCAGFNQHYDSIANYRDTINCLCDPDGDPSTSPPNMNGDSTGSVCKGCLSDDSGIPQSSWPSFCYNYCRDNGFTRNPYCGSIFSVQSSQSSGSDGIIGELFGVDVYASSSFSFDF